MKFDKKIIRLITLAFVVILSAYSTALLSQTIFYDEFIDNRNHWENEAEATEISKVENGKYYVKVLDKGWHYFTIPVAFDYSRNFVIETKFLVGGNPLKVKGAFIKKNKNYVKGYVGLIWGADHKIDNFWSCTYSPWIKATGYHSFSRTNENGFTPIFRTSFGDDHTYQEDARGSYNLKLIKSEGKVSLYVNDVLQFTEDYYQPYGDGIGFYLDGEQIEVTFESLGVAYLNETPGINNEPKSNRIVSGTGFAISSNGYLITNCHVIDEGSSISIKGVNGDFNKSLSAKVVVKDNANDIALLKITDASFTGAGTIPYTFAFKNAQVGNDVYALGYPLRATMGDEVKLTNGIISANSGFEGAINQYQISVPVQPGNSGGPLINSAGNIVGVVNAKHTGTENVSYAIKGSFLTNLIESSGENIVLPQTNLLTGKPLSEQVQLLKKFVYIIEVE